MKLTLALAFVLGGAAASTAVPPAKCASVALLDEPGKAGRASPGGPAMTVDQAIVRVAGYLDRTSMDEPVALLILGIVHRQFGGEKYRYAASRYQKIIPQKPNRAPTLRAFRRVLIGESSLDPDDLNALVTDIDRLTAPALHCDRLPLGAGYRGRLLKAAAGDAFTLTHAALAWAWMRENKCDVKLPPDFEARLIDGMAGLIDDDAAVTDLEVEAAVLLYTTGYRDRVPPKFIDRVVQAQKRNGGFAFDSAATGAGDWRRQVNWHTSVLALWLMLHHRCGSANAMPMLASPRARKQGHENRDSNELIGFRRRFRASSVPA